jgi:hypothetical protein
VTQEQHYLNVLREASAALDAACRLLDKAFKTPKWRRDWTIPEMADKVRQEVEGFGDFDRADAEAARRNASELEPVWQAIFNTGGTPLVRHEDATAE